ncbi:hypothetical protein EDB81DRAFT_831331, partial [Dactylonectria macrodidyma]
MSTQSDSQELRDMSQGKTRDPNVEHAAEEFDRDDLDREQLAKLGKKSVLKRNFRFLTILGFSCAILVTWEGTLMNFAPGLANGGPAGLVYGFIFVWIGNLSVFSTLCELVSIAPTSGGQYHWVAMLAPRWCSKFLSYITGWLTLAECSDVIGLDWSWIQASIQSSPGLGTGSLQYIQNGSSSYCYPFGTINEPLNKQISGRTGIVPLCVVIEAL